MSAETAWKRQTALVALLLLTITVMLSRIQAPFFPLYQVQSQDLVPLLCLSVSLLVASVWTPSWRLPAKLPGPHWLALFGMALVGLLAIGTHVLMKDFPLSIDERMVLFDMAVFGAGDLATPLAESWRPYVQALVPAFLLNDDMPAALVSSYLPMNSLLRLTFSKLANPALFNPLLAFAGGVALVSIARRTFEQDDRACWVVLIVYALSAQMLVNAMTVYSMTGHMALNLIWLAAFLRGGRLGHAIAIAIGLVATGFHQIAFHPFFVAPFLIWRLSQRQWTLVLLYGLAYAAIVLWWAYYPGLVAQEVISAASQSSNAGLVERVSKAFAERRGDTVITTVLNILRFLAWQHLALLPLLIAAGAVAVRERGLAAALLLGILLWMAFIVVVIPFQGHGWGYRYLHGFLGSFALLAGFGYRRLSEILGTRADGLVVSLSGMTALVTIPTSIVAANQFVEPYFEVEKLVSAQSTPLVLIDTNLYPTTDRRWAPNAIENVRNLPDLSNRPLRLSSRNLSAEAVVDLCRKGKITLITRDDQRRVGFGTNISTQNESFASVVRQARKQKPDCFAMTQDPRNSLEAHR